MKFGPLSYLIKQRIYIVLKSRQPLKMHRKSSNVEKHKLFLLKSLFSSFSFDFCSLLPREGDGYETEYFIDVDFCHFLEKK